MVAARRQKQAQKLQEQQISKALAESKPSSNHVSFDEDDERNDTEHVPETTTNLTTSSVDDAGAEPLIEGSDDDDEPIEVVSNKTSRKQAAQDSARLRAQEKAEKAKRQAAERKKLEKAKQKEPTKALQIPAQVADQAARSDNESEGGSEVDEPSSSNRLDPSLFAQVFAQPVAAPRSILKKRSAEERADEVAKLQRERKQRRKEQRAGGVVKGRDGLPMKRGEDGTVLRALTTTNKRKTSFDDDHTAESQAPLDQVVRPALLDPSASLPNAKARAFKKRNLLRKKSAFPSSASSKTSGSSKSKKSEDDPLGLNDPAFLPGGEFYHLMNKGSKAKLPKQGRQEALATARQAYRGGGTRKDALSVLRARSRGGPSLGFARSQEASDDEN